MLFQKIVQLKDTVTDKVYEIAPEVKSSGCQGCAFEHDSVRCQAAPDTCSVSRIIWKEVE
jgi:hypothetical protein